MATDAPSEKRPRSRLRILLLACLALIVIGGVTGWYIWSHPRNHSADAGQGIPEAMKALQMGFDQLGQAGKAAGDFMQKLSDNRMNEAYAATTTGFRTAVSQERFEKFVREEPAFHQKSINYHYSFAGGTGTTSVSVTTPPGSKPDNNVYLALVSDEGKPKVSGLTVNGHALP